MIDERSDFDLAGELSDASHVVAMKMGNQHIIDLVDACGLSRTDDAAGVPAIKSGPAGIDEHGLARRGNNQCCLPAFYIDKKDLKGLRLGGELGCAKQHIYERLQQESAEKETHLGSLLDLRIHKTDLFEDVNLQDRRSVR